MDETKQIQAQYKKMTETPIPKLITTLSIPTILIMHAIFGLSGLEKAPSISEVISAFISLPFMIQFEKTYQKKNKPVLPVYCFI